MKYITFFSMLFFISIISSCDDAVTDSSLTIDDLEFEPTDWTSESHSKSADPNFDEVFDNSAVKRLDIVISENNWQVMLDDMTNLYGAFGASAGGPPGGPPGGGPGGVLVETDNPIFIPADVFYNDIQWYKVGVRFKGNSSLQSSWQSGILKLSLKLDFDEFEDDYPQINNQRFYGFKKLSLKNNFEDQSFLREKVTAEIFRDAGLAVSHTAFYDLYIDTGDGPEYFGLYTLVEEVDDTVIETQFASVDGNLYKPEYTGASFEEGTFSESDFTKKTNEDDNDWSDIQALFEALHADTRSNNPEAWRTDLDSIFDTDVFLKYLAVNTVVQNWDTYGRMTHNYYLYNNPDNGKLTWIPWDNNEALQDGKMGGSLNLDFSDLLSGNWPLIEYLYADDVYRNKYDTYVNETRSTVFAPGNIQVKYAEYAALVEPSAVAEIAGLTFLYSSSNFQSAISQLNAHADNRASAVDNYLN
ncbi:MAG: CotH kinase family protein [FCB group bacterium]|nr:CotH kinase family protein [FCB group bacterium]MBL7028201.1 CotH kinase family protein [Candidatus Neomarinimicrobiota bacterium]MBL7122493.1 CotH kinase family protein [Candidatus Neomarinimicrobiota bacterium]